MPDSTLVIIPTYNELDNLSKLLPDLLNRYEFINILIVDDNSPDGSAEFVEDLSKTDKRVNLLKREKKMGLGTAYIAGFKYALERGYDYVIQMDADYSHDPKEISNFLKEIKEYDLVLGSRYVKGVNVINWPMTRLLLSYFASAYTRAITWMPVKDATGGYKCFRKEVLKGVNLDKVKSNGYSFQIEMTYKAWKKGFKIKEIPIVFIDRAAGTSKMSKRIVREAIFMVWKLRLRSILGIL